jgi:hypothetical protein
MPLCHIVRELKRIEKRREAEANALRAAYKR